VTTIEKPAKPAEEKQSAGKTVTNLLIGLVVLVAGLALIFSMVPGGPTTKAGPPGTVSSAGSGAPVPAQVLAPGATMQTLGAATPLRVDIPSISASSSLVATGLKPDGSLDVPPVSQPQQASWYDQSPTPGELGPSVVLGHVNGNGKQGVFANLDKVVAGALVTVDRADGQRVTFKVSRVETFPKSSFPTDLVYNDTPNAALRLITCGGDYDPANRNYLSNVVVYADLVDVQRI
jgi:hypothetical protein